MATVTSLGSQYNTTAGNKTVTATPAVGDLTVVVDATTGIPPEAVTTISDNNPDGLGVYTQAVGPAVGYGTSGSVSIWVRNDLVGSASSTVFTQTETGSSGGGLLVFTVTGMAWAGMAAVYSSGYVNFGGPGLTPAVIMSLACNAAYPVIAAVANANNPITVAPQTSPAYTEAAKLVYSSPTSGLEIMFIESGETGAFVAWGSTSTSGYGAVAVQLDHSPASSDVQALVLRPRST
jgi:hypothetical protein